MDKKNRVFNNSKQRWSLRKLTIGLASVMLGVIFVTGGNVVKADVIDTNVSDLNTNNKLNNKTEDLKNDKSSNAELNGDATTVEKKNVNTNLQNNNIASQKTADFEVSDNTTSDTSIANLENKKVMKSTVTSDSKNKLAAYDDHKLANNEARIKNQDDLNNYLSHQSEKSIVYFENSDPITFSSNSPINVTKNHNNLWYFTEKSTGNINFNDADIAIDNSAFMGWYFTGDHKNQKLENLTVYGSVSDTVNSHGEIDTSNNGGFNAQLIHASNLAFDNLTFKASQTANSHIFDVMGSDHITFDNDQFLGYSHNLTQDDLNKMFAKNEHSVIAEAIQIDHATFDSNGDAQGEKYSDNPVTARIFDNKLADGKVTSYVTINNSKFRPYSGKTGSALIHGNNDKVDLKYSVGIGAHTNSANFAPLHINVTNNIFEHAISVTNPAMGGSSARDYINKTRFLNLYPIHFITSGDSEEGENTLVAKNNKFLNQNTAIYVDPNGNYDYNGVNPTNPEKLDEKAWYANKSAKEYTVEYYDGNTKLETQSKLPDFTNEIKFNNKDYLLTDFRLISDDNGHQTYKVNVVLDKRTPKEKLAAYDNHRIYNNEVRITNQQDLNNYLALNKNNRAEKNIIYFENTTPIKFDGSQINVIHIDRWYFTEKSTGNIDFNNTALAIKDGSQMSWYFTGNHKKQKLENLNIYGSVKTIVDKNGNAKDNSGNFITYMVKADNLAFKNMNFYDAQAFNRNLFNVMGSNNITFDGVNCYGYGGNFSQDDWNNIYTKNPNGLRTEAIRLNVATFPASDLNIKSYKEIGRAHV